MVPTLVTDKSRDHVSAHVIPSKLLGTGAEDQPTTPLLGWEHINLSGDYAWLTDKRVAKGGFRPLRAPETPPARLSRGNPTLTLVANSLPGVALKVRESLSG